VADAESVIVWALEQRTFDRTPVQQKAAAIVREFAFNGLEVVSRAEIERLRSAVALHRPTITETPDDRWQCCESCGADWPCPTAKAVSDG
jgi:hypothetical protein